MSKPPFDLRLYLVLGQSDCAGRALLEVAAQAVAGGVTLVQLREKDSDRQQVTELARALIAVLRPQGIPLIINDDLDVTLASGAEGLHVGQDDLTPARVRDCLPRDRLLGLSVGDATEAVGADPGLVDYVGLGPVFATPTKGDAGQPLGIAGLAKLRSLLPGLPAVAIGGIKLASAAQVMATGVQGLAVVSAIAGAADPAAAARALRAALDQEPEP